MIPRRLHQLWEKVGGWFWAPCPECGQMFGGHEASHTSKVMDDGAHLLVCKNCAPMVADRELNRAMRQIGDARRKALNPEQP